MTTPLIEAIARKLESVVDCPDRAEEVAQAALTAIAEAGYAILPRDLPIRTWNAIYDAMDPWANCDCSPGGMWQAALTADVSISAAQGDGA